MINMFVMRCVVRGLFWVVGVVGFFGGARGLQLLAAGEDNDIMTTEERLRATTNTLFALLRLRGAKDRPRLQQYSLVHNYFITLTLQDYNTLREIAKLTRVDKKSYNDNNNIISTFIAVLNEILDDENVSNLLAEAKKIYDLDDEIRELKLLKQHYIDPVYTMNINKDVLKLLEDDGPPDKPTSKATDTPLSPPNNLIDIDREILRLLDDDNVVSYTTESVSTKNTNGTNKNVTDDGFWREEDTLPIQRRIFGGQKTKIHHYPFMATVQMFNKFQCGGSIIKDDLVITAASCLQLAWNNRFYRENPAFLTVRIGSSFYESGGEVVPIFEVYFYPSYDPQKLRHNLAVMRMLRKIRWHRRVKKIPLDQLESPLPLNTDGIMVIGWGAQLSSNIILNPMVNKMKYSVLDYYPLEECQVIYSKEYVTQKNFCAGFMSTGGGACNRDVGGPGVVSGYLAGIISFGSPVCGRVDSPTVFTKVGYYYDWIEEIMEQDVPNVKARTTLLTDRPMTFINNDEFTTPYWTVTPIMKSKRTTVATTTTSTEQDEKKIKDKKGFREFLKTMFDSKEIEDYFDRIRKEPKKSESGDKKLSSRYRLRMDKGRTTTESSDDEEPIMATQLGFDPTWTTSPISDDDKDDDNGDEKDFGVDDDNDDDDFSPLREDSHTTTSPDLEMFEVVDQDSIDEDKELENRILKLVKEAEISPLTKPTPTYPKKNGKHGERTAKNKIDKVILSMIYSSENDESRTTTEKPTEEPDKKKDTVEMLIENDNSREEETTTESTDKSMEIDITLENLKQEKKHKKKKKLKQKASRDEDKETFSRDGIIETFKRDGADNINGTETNDEGNVTMPKDVGLDDFLSGNILFEIFQDAIAEINSTLNTPG